MSRVAGDARRLRILVINWLDRKNPRAGGAEVHLHEIFGRLASRGHEVTALVSGWPGCAHRERLDGIDVHRTGTRYTFSLTAPLHYRRALSGRGFDVVVEDLNKIPVFSRLWVGAPVVLMTHHLFGTSAFHAASWPVALVTVLLEAVVPAAFGGVSVIAVSESTKQELVRRGIRADLVEVVHNGIDLAYFAPAPECAAARPTVLFLGRLKRYKRVDLVIDAVARLAAEGLDAELRVGGDGDQMEAIHAQVGRLGLGDRVHVLGFLGQAEKREALRAAWVHALTSSKEGWGISNIEAAACGVPSVASDAPGLRESVLDGRTGILVPHGDVPALATALGRLLRDPELRASMGREARAFAERFSWDASADAVEGVLRRVVAASGPH